MIRYIQIGLAALSILLCILELILIACKRNKIYLADTPFEKLMAKLPSIITKAETLSSDGHYKKSFVLSVSYAFLADLLGISVDEVAEQYCGRISEAIESILETPTKKGVNI